MYKVNSELNRCQDRLKDIKEGKSFGSLILIKNALGSRWIGPEDVLLERHIKKLDAQKAKLELKLGIRKE